MSFDPNFPPTNALLVSSEFRNQFNSLKALIDAIVSFTAAQVDNVSTLNPGDAANVGVSAAGSTLHFTFAIPRGADGAPGAPFANAVVDGVNTLNPGSNATVGITFDGTNVHFVFGIPRGNDGADGTNGVDGAPGEVTNAALAAAIAGTSSNSNGVATLNLVVSDPPTQAEMQSIADKQDELILALRH